MGESSVGMKQTPLDRLQSEFDRAAERVERFLTSEEGVRLRQQIAAGLVVVAPAVAMAARTRLPRIGRLAGTATLTAAVVTLAQRIRDWQPSSLPSGDQRPD